MFNLYENIQSLCEERGKTISGVCVAVGISKSTLSNLKNGRSDSISKKTAQKIADFLEVPLETVLYGEKETPLVNGDEELTEYMTMLRDRPEMRMLFSVTKNATRADVEAAVRIIEALRGGQDQE